ncbi:FliG C-terminal domain-containing protein [Haematobacter missouriensis]|uniref:Flagellar motor switch protein FliG n=1 Tax=Haematobacter missouriensis TaxID=366616 RepID=A0A212AY90_9RHOB|nr:FliG C-terminal domain-containing protein [Haematobacter missouriensis]OWJ86428.1 flagellar motor switch protein FliG [Haematobacter missouriensis]
MSAAALAISPLRPAPAHKVLSGPQKAAIMVRLLLAEGAEVPLSSLPVGMQESLTRELARLRLVDRETLVSVIEEFVAELEAVGLAFPGGLEGALNLLSDQLSTPAITRLRRLARTGEVNDPWDLVLAQADEPLLALLERESAEVGAVLISKLPTGRAATLLGKLPGDRARRLAYSMSLTGGIAPEMVARIGATLAAPIEAQARAAFDEGPVERIGAILNSSANETREDVLKGLEEEDAELAGRVRRAIFTYADIPERIEPRDVARIVRGLDQTDLLLALAGSRGPESASSAFILKNISQRLAAGLTEEIALLPESALKQTEKAQNAVVTRIRDLISSGELTLRSMDG